MKKPSNNGSMACIQLQDGDGRSYIARVKRNVATELKQASEKGSLVKIAVDEHGRIGNIRRGNGHASLPLRMQRFAVQIEPPAYPVYMPDEWKELLAKVINPGNKRKRFLFHGSEGGGKTTLIRLIITECYKQWGAAGTVVLVLRAEPDDRFVGALESKLVDYAETTGLLIKAGYRVIWQMPELEAQFAVGDYRPGWDLKYQASLRELLNGAGPSGHEPHLVLADCNYLDRLEPPVQSRFHKVHITVSQGFARGLLTAHWPTDLPLNGTPNSQLIRMLLDRCYREPVATATRASRKKQVLRVPDLTAWNGRFLSDFAADIEERTQARIRKEAGFVADEGFVLSVLADHLAAAVRPLVEAAGTHAIRRFLVQHHDPLDPIVAVEPTLDWCSETQFLAS
jgi:hypothetical protein